MNRVVPAPRSLSPGADARCSTISISSSERGLRPERKGKKVSLFAAWHELHWLYSELRYGRHLPVLYPNGPFMSLWRPMLFCAIVFAISMAPFDMAFYWWQPPIIYKVVGIVLDVFFILDVFLHFNVAVICHGELVTDRRLIAKRYAKTYLLFDVISNTPFDWFIGTEGKGRKLMKLFKLPKILRFVKLLRVVKDQTQYVGVMSTVGGIFCSAHYYTCFWTWTLLGDCEDDMSCPSVGATYVEGFSISMAGLGGADSWTRFLLTDGTSLLASGRVPGEPLEPVQELMAASTTVVGFLLIACLFANVASAIMAKSEVGRKRYLMLQRRIAEMRAARVPQALQEKVEATYEHLWRFGGERDGMLRDPSLSLDLRRNLALCVYGRALRNVPIFANMPDRYLKCLAQKIEMRLYSPGDLLVLLGEVGTDLFFIHSGAVQPVGEDGEPLRDIVLRAGAFFGEICFLQPGARRTASVICVEFCRAMVLTISAFEELDLTEHLDAIRQESLAMRQKYVQASVKLNSVLDDSVLHEEPEEAAQPQAAPEPPLTPPSARPLPSPEPPPPPESPSPVHMDRPPERCGALHEEAPQPRMWGSHFETHLGRAQKLLRRNTELAYSGGGKPFAGLDSVLHQLPEISAKPALLPGAGPASGNRQLEAILQAVARLQVTMENNHQELVGRMATVEDRVDRLQVAIADCGIQVPGPKVRQSRVKYDSNDSSSIFGHMVRRDSATSSVYQDLCSDRPQPESALPPAVR